MPNYKSTTVAGESWNRFCRIMIENPLNAPEAGENGVPSILVVEEEITPRRDGKYGHQIVSNLSTSFNPSATFPVLNPLTDAPTGQTMTHAELYAVLYSLVMKLAADRDAA